jgi:hypothetical protein
MTCFIVLILFVKIMEGGVMRLHDLPGSLGGGGDDDRVGAEVEEHERAMAPRQVLQGAVREAADQMVEAADDGQLPRAWREPETVLTRARVEVHKR